MIAPGSSHPDPEQVAAWRKTVLDAVAAHGGNIGATARALGVARQTVQGHVRRARQLEQPERAFRVVSAPPSLDKPIASLWDERLASGERVAARVKHGERFEVAIHERGPVGILHLGDPHLDDPGCDFQALHRDIELVRSTPGLYAGLIGDCTNNWVGRLARLWARQDVTQQESFRLTEEMILRLGPRLIYLTDGNHDLFHGDNDPLRWIMGYHSPALHEQHGVRIEFSFPAGAPVRMSARHEWPGGSQYNPAFGQGKAAFRGRADEIIVGGHKHASGYFTYYNGENGRLSHCIQIGSYKVIDDFAIARGFPANNLSPSVMTVIDPLAESETERVTVFQSAAHGAVFLAALRARA